MNLRAGRLTARVNYLNGRTDLGAPSAQIYIMPENYGHISESVWSSVAQLDSTARRALNELRVGWQRDRILRSPHPGSAPFPAVRVDFPDGSNLRLGSDATSQANSTNQDVIELTDDFTWVRGAHTFTVGTHDEFSRFATLFIQNLYGSYEFSSIDNLRAGVAQSFLRTFSNTPYPRQDYSRLFARAALTPAICGGPLSRGNVRYAWRRGPGFPDTRDQPADVVGIRLRHRCRPVAPHVVTAGRFQLVAGREPRVSSYEIRGGAGLFAAAHTYGWRTYTNTGLDFTALSLPFAAANPVPFVANPGAQPGNVGGAGRQTVNLIDPRFRFPQVFEAECAFDASRWSSGSPVRRTARVEDDRRCRLHESQLRRHRCGA